MCLHLRVEGFQGKLTVYHSESRAVKVINI
jgi:hypothetical protein